MRSLPLALTLALVAGTCQSPPGASPASVRILFIGNSLTGSNDLPGMVRALARSGASEPLVEAVVIGGTSLEDHWTIGSADSALLRQWDVVILQQGPSALEESRRSLREWAGRFAPRIRAAGARPALYMVWPSRERAGDFDRVSDSYRLAAEDVDGLLLPAGEAWRAAWRRDPGLALWSADGLHPTPEGTYLAALVIAAGVLERAPGDLARPGIPGLSLTAERDALLRAAADEALRRFAAGTRTREERR